MAKDQIDEVIKISEFYKESTFSAPMHAFDALLNRLQERIEPARLLEAPFASPPELVVVPPPPVSVGIPPAAEPELYERVTTKIIENPTRDDFERYGKRDVEIEPRSERGAGRRSRSRHESVREVFEERRVVTDELGPGGGQIVLGEAAQRRSERDIKAEIRALEAQARLLKLREVAEERRARADRARELEYARADRLVEREVEVEPVERRSDRDVVRVEKDRRGRLNLVRSTH